MFKVGQQVLSRNNYDFRHASAEYKTNKGAWMRKPGLQKKDAKKD